MAVGIDELEISAHLGEGDGQAGASRGIRTELEINGGAIEGHLLLVERGDTGWMQPTAVDFDQAVVAGRGSKYCVGIEIREEQIRCIESLKTGVSGGEIKC